MTAIQHPILSKMCAAFERAFLSYDNEVVIECLVALRQRLQDEMFPEPWTACECSVALFLNDVCDALLLTESGKRQVFGGLGITLLEMELAGRNGDINDRQKEACRYCLAHGRINLAEYRAICPIWSDETLRLDLRDLVERGMLVKEGAGKGSVYRVSTIVKGAL